MQPVAATTRAMSDASQLVPGNDWASQEQAAQFVEEDALAQAARDQSARHLTRRRADEAELSETEPAARRSRVHVSQTNKMQLHKRLHRPDTLHVVYHRHEGRFYTSDWPR